MSDNIEHEEHQEEATLDRLLTAEGKRWRRTMDARLPEMSAFVAQMRQRLTGEDAKQFTALSATIADKGDKEKNTQKGIRIMSIDTSDTSTSSSSVPVTPHPPRRRFAGVAAGAAALVIVALIAATLAFTLHNRQHATTPGSGTHQKTPVVTGKTPTAATQTPVQDPTGAGPYDYRPLVIAPSDPQIVYTVLHDGTEPVRSSDGGATFQPIAMPPTTLTGTLYKIVVSPLDANHIIIGAYTTACVPQGDPEHRAQLSASLDTPICEQQFFSADGGQAWSALNLPLSGGIGTIDGTLRAFSLSYSEQATLFAQGTRLYAAAASEAVNGFELLPAQHSTTRLVVSNDGGASWQFADNGLSNGLCDFAPAPSGNTVYALAASGCTLWRSNNAGASWSQVNSSLAGQDKGMIVASNGALYINTLQDVEVSVDGGQSFTQAPTDGLPSGQSLNGPLGVLSDGSVVMESGEGSYTEPTALYAWRAGQASWRQIGPKYSGAIVWAVIVPHGGSDVVYEIHLNESISHFTV